MCTTNKNDTVLRLQFIGVDYWSRPVYKDQHGHLWKDVDLGDSEYPSLHSAVNDDFDGEPDMPINQEFIIESKPPKNPFQFNYQLLDRMRMDCEYYLGYGNRNPSNLWANNEEQQIETMKNLWNGFPDDAKPEWLTMEQIEQYEKAMLS